MHPVGRNDRGYSDALLLPLTLNDELTFVDKQSPAIHIAPCPACPDWLANQQHASSEE
jgi:hypothetical protein